MAQQYGRWHIVKQLGEGGQSHIYLVEDKQNRTIAVLKRLKNIKRIERFKTEFEVMSSRDEQSKLHFPEIFDADLTAEKPYFVMEYFPAGCLTENLVKGWTLEEKADLYVHLVLAVGYANLKGVIHRDLKPENILVTDKRPKVTDFGICFLDDKGERQTMLDEAMGSFRFMAPEMEDGQTDLIGMTTDIYSLGKIAYWLFAGRIYNREKHRDPSFDLAKEGKDSWRHYLNDFLDKTTNHDPKKRIQQTAEVIVEFENVRLAMTQGIRYLDVNVEQECSFCRRGKYMVQVNSIGPNSTHATAIENYGFTPRGNPQALILVCDLCGNIQYFRKDFTNKWGWKN